MAKTGEKLDGCKIIGVQRISLWRPFHHVCFIMVKRIWNWNHLCWRDNVDMFNTFGYG